MPPLHALEQAFGSGGVRYFAFRSQPVEAELTNGMLRIHYRSTTRRLAAVSPWM